MASFDIQLKKLIDELEQFPSKLLDEMDKRIDFEDALEDTHKKAQDPYEERWPKRKGNYSHPPLIKTGRLLKSYEQKRRRNNISIRNTAPYSGYLQSRYRIIPERDEGIPAHWLKKIKQVATELIREFNGK